jgi:hypothetical protein
VGPRLFFQRVPEGKVVKIGCILTRGSAPGWWVEERVAAAATTSPLSPPACWSGTSAPGES